MGTIKITTQPDRDLTVYTVEGTLSIEEIDAHAREHNASELPNVVWDFRGGRVPVLPSVEIDAAVRQVNVHVEHIPGRRVALVTNEKLDFGLIRIWNVLSEERSEIEHRAFYDYQDALDWFDG